MQSGEDISLGATARGGLSSPICVCNSAADRDLVIRYGEVGFDFPWVGETACGTLLAREIGERGGVFGTRTVEDDDVVETLHSANCPFVCLLLLFLLG